MWDVARTEAHGIERYPFGPEGTVSLKAAARRTAGETPRLTVETDVPFDLTVNWGDGRSRTVRVTASGEVKL